MRKRMFFAGYAEEESFSGKDEMRSNRDEDESRFSSDLNYCTRRNNV